MQDDILSVQSGYGHDFEVPIAGLGARSYAYLIDWHIRIVAAVAWLGITQLLIFLIGMGDVMPLQVFSVAPPLLIYFLYHPVIELMMEGNTPGKRFAKVRVVTVDGDVPGTGAILIRNLLRLLDGMPAIYVVGMTSCMLTRQHVRIGDLAAGTLLVYESEVDGLTEQVQEFIDQDALSLKEMRMVRQLLARWDELTPQRRSTLGWQLLEKLDPDFVFTRDEAKLHARLVRLGGSR